MYCINTGCEPGDGFSSFVFNQNPTGRNIRTGTINDQSQINIHSGLDVSLTSDQVNLGGFLGATNIRNNNLAYSIVRGATLDSTTVPELSKLAIFALGIMGFASRRFKKQC